MFDVDVSVNGKRSQSVAEEKLIWDLVKVDGESK